jgi:hypothetical protein
MEIHKWLRIIELGILLTVASFIYVNSMILFGLVRAGVKRNIDKPFLDPKYLPFFLWFIDLQLL